MANSIATAAQIAQNDAASFEALIAGLDLSKLDNPWYPMDVNEFWFRVRCCSDQIKRLAPKDKQIAKSLNAKNPSQATIMRLQSERREILRMIGLQLDIIRKILTKHRIAF